MKTITYALDIACLCLAYLDIAATPVLLIYIAYTIQ